MSNLPFTLYDLGQLAVSEAAIADRGRFTPRSDDYSEPVPARSARAVLVALAWRSPQIDSDPGSGGVGETKPGGGQ